LIQAAVENIGAPLFICEAQSVQQRAPGRIHVLYANPASKELTAADPEELIGQDLVLILTPNVDSAARHRLQDLLQLGQPATIPGLRAASGREYELHAFPLGREPEELTHLAILLHDVTADRKRGRRWESREDALEEIVAKRTAELEVSHEALQRSERMASMGTLVAGLGHDLNNLLLPIRGHLAALEAAALDESIRGHVKAIGQAAEYLRQLNDNLRLFALDPERRDDSHGVTNISDWWTRLRTLLKRAISPTVKLRVELPQDLPAVDISAHRLTQAVLNLLINASEAITERGRIRLWAETVDDRSCVRLGVTDNGRGMSAQVRRRALDPFFTTKRRGRGTGLGLPLVHGIVRSVGGSIEIDSKPRCGTTVVLNLPVAPDDAVAHAAGSRAADTAAVTVGHQRIRACFEALLASAGFKLRAARTGTPGTVAVWVTEPGPGALRAAQELRVAKRDCRILLFGKGSDEWLSLGACVVDREGGLSAMREALAQALPVGK
jgi:signal transduction histidine kinase